MAANRFLSIFAVVAVACFAMVVVDGRTLLQRSVSLRQAGNETSNNTSSGNSSTSGNSSSSNSTSNSTDSNITAVFQQTNAQYNKAAQEAINAGVTAISDGVAALQNALSNAFTNPSNAVENTREYWDKTINIGNTYSKAIADANKKSLDAINTANTAVSQGIRNFFSMFG